MTKRLTLLVVGLAAALGCGGFVSIRAALPEAAKPLDDNQGGDSQVTVRAIHPRRDANFGISVEQPAYVKAYYQADLMAKVAGPLKMLDVDIGDRVHAGETLAQVDVPDISEEVLQKEAFVKQRIRELELSRTNVKTAADVVAAAAGSLQVREADVLKAAADERFRGKELKRFQGLAAGDSPAVTADIIDERQQLYETAQAASASARGEVVKAKAVLEEARAKLDAARADVKLADALVDVAGKDRDRAKAVLSYASISAPFDGLVTSRNFDPGSFVQNAATGRGEPIVSVARTDLVTIYMKVPDNYATYVTRGTEAVIKLGVLRGWEIHAKVTRFSPSLETPEHDRTMRVEVDLFNGSREEYDRFAAAAKAAGYAGLKGRTLPFFPDVKGKSTPGLEGRLLPGMFGKMRLVLRSFSDSFLIPSTAVFSEGGRRFIFIVKDDRVTRVPVEDQVDDGRLAKVVLTGTKTELNGTETIVLSNQGELSDGQKVKPTLTEW
jgi:multidrug resistance efflux pump